MAGAESDPPEAAKYTGLQKIFNSETIKGRANVRNYLLHNKYYFFTWSVFVRLLLIFYSLFQCAKATFAALGLIVAFFTLKPKSKK